ncbi:MAG: WYL domain-containing protein [Planctomycetes bacterium]|nr:WYL domain-containing protein [Planctomycetota bacterium]MCA8936437.1 WYL domain-containing protein [Planctomycetota bacterium]MCA8945548.1 WYL domain-containing protein [Planctomycetota bacterium]
MPIAIGPTERQLNLLSTLLKARGPISWHDIARIDGYSDDETSIRSRQKRFERDMKALENTGLRVSRTTDGVRPSYEIDRGACLLPSLPMSPEQRLLMFRIGMSYLEHDDAGPFKKHLSSALLKLQAGAGSAGLPADLPRTFVKRSLNRRPAESNRLAVIGEALLERRRVTFQYEGQRRDGVDKRTVAPYALVSRRGGWYLVGYDTARKGVRTFRLSRIRGTVSLATPQMSAPEYDVPTDFDAEGSFSTEVFGRGDNAFKDVQIAFDAEVAFVVENEFAGIYKIEKRKDGSITLHLPQAYPGELLRYLGEFPGHWEVRKPTELREMVVKNLKAALKTLEGRAR